MASVAAGFASGDHGTVARMLAALRYYTRFLDEVEAFEAELENR
jgi:hypothetical protein